MISFVTALLMYVSYRYISDGNHLYAQTLSIIDGLGPYGGGMYTNEEFILLESYKQSLELKKILLNRIFGKLKKE